MTEKDIKELKEDELEKVNGGTQGDTRILTCSGCKSEYRITEAHGTIKCPCGHTLYW